MLRLLLADVGETNTGGSGLKAENVPLFQHVKWFLGSICCVFGLVNLLIQETKNSALTSLGPDFWSQAL